MKKIGKNSKKGFTLVELIVVLVILAIMAAMLVPALTGYIDEARKSKDYNAASEVLTATQAVMAEYYASDADPTVAEANQFVTVGRVRGLVGMTDSELTAINITGINESTCEITGMTVTLSSGTYTWNGTSWSAAQATT